MFYLKRIFCNRHFHLKNRTYCLVLKVTMGALILYTVICGLVSVTASTKRSSPPIIPNIQTERNPWVWECQNGNCVRVPSGSLSEKFSSNFSSIGECRLVCLPFSTIWPQPTGMFKISREVQAVNPSEITFNTEKVRGGDPARDFLREISLEVFMRSVRSLCPQFSQPSNLWFSADEMKSESDETKSNIPEIAASPIQVFFTTNSSNDLVLDYTTNEAYTLVINNTQSSVIVNISSVTVFGARHALQTLSQLFGCRKGPTNTLLIMSDAKITDEPIYSHRGLLLDTARSFLPVSAILRTLDAMAASKLNVFHWHATDSQSFPLYSKNVPNLSRYGAYSPKEVYMPMDVKMIRDYAFLRGIRIILEIDAPSHAGYGWQWGEAEKLGKLAVCIGAQPWTKYCIQPPCGQLNPTNQHVYDVLKKLYSDIQNRFPRDMFHMGGDEVFLPCWQSEASITNWMKERGMNTSTEGMIQLWSMFQSFALEAWDQATNKTVDKTPIILWSSQLTDPKNIDKYLSPSRYIIETWTEKSDDTPLELISKGYKVIMATKDAWYLDHGFWGGTIYHKWNDVYDNRIFDPQLGVYGGEACLWGEYVNEGNLDSRLWPRAACLAERLWSDPETSSHLALPRLLDHTQRISLFGIQPDSILPEWCRNNDGLC